MEVRRGPCLHDEALVNDAVREHVRKMRRYRFMNGAMAWQREKQWANAANLHVASRTTDIDALCFHLEMILANKQRHHASPEFAEMLFTVSVLQVHTAKMNRGRKMPSICHQNPRLAMLVSQTLDVLRQRNISCFSELGRWLLHLDVQPPPQTSGSRKRSACAQSAETSVEVPSDENWFAEYQNTVHCFETNLGNVERDVCAE